MKRYKVQAAYGERIYDPVIHSNESAASDEVAYLLGTWLRRNWEQIISMEIDEAHNHPEFMNSLVYLLENVPQLISAGKIWDAFDLYEDFYVRFENEFGYPLFVKMGTVIVEGSKKTGLKNRVELLEVTDEMPLLKYRGKSKQPLVTVNRRENLKAELLNEVVGVISRKASLKGIRVAMEDILMAAVTTERALDASGKYDYQDEATEAAYLEALRKGILRKIFPSENELFPGGGKTLGALTSWMVQYGDFGGAWHGVRHTSESRAKLQTKDYLLLLLEHLRVHSDSQALVKRNAKYVKAANQIIEDVQYLFEHDLVWTAYLAYKDFEQEWSRQLGPIPLEMSIGSMRVIPTPDPEQCHGSPC